MNIIAYVLLILAQIGMTAQKWAQNNGKLDVVRFLEVRLFQTRSSCTLKLAFTQTGTCKIFTLIIYLFIARLITIT
jgi:hypothetical protein